MSEDEVAKLTAYLRGEIELKALGYRLGEVVELKVTIVGLRALVTPLMNPVAALLIIVQKPVAVAAAPRVRTVNITSNWYCETAAAATANGITLLVPLQITVGHGPDYLSAK